MCRRRFARQHVHVARVLPDHPVGREEFPIQMAPYQAAAQREDQREHAQLQVPVTIAALASTSASHTPRHVPETTKRAHAHAAASHVPRRVRRAYVKYHEQQRYEDHLRDHDEHDTWRRVPQKRIHAHAEREEEPGHQHHGRQRPPVGRLALGRNLAPAGHAAAAAHPSLRSAHLGALRLLLLQRLLVAPHIREGGVVQVTRCLRRTTAPTAHLPTAAPSGSARRGRASSCDRHRW